MKLFKCLFADTETTAQEHRPGIDIDLAISRLVDTVVALFKVLLAGAVALLLLGLILSASQKQNEWEVFKTAHACKVVTKMQGDTRVGFGSGLINGKVGIGTMISTEPNKTAFLCDDGITYWRNN